MIGQIFLNDSERLQVGNYEIHNGEVLEVLVYNDETKEAQWTTTRVEYNWNKKSYYLVGVELSPVGLIAKINYGLIETKSRRMQLLVQPSLHARLKEKAQTSGRSINDYVHEILEKFLNENN